MDKDSANSMFFVDNTKFDIASNAATKSKSNTNVSISFDVPTPSFPYATSNVTKHYKHMFTKTHERAMALDDNLTSLAKAMYEGSGGSDGGLFDNLTPVGVPEVSGNNVQVLGRICNEAHEGRINKTAVMLEGSRDESGGRRVMVDLAAVKEYR